MTKYSIKHLVIAIIAIVFLYYLVQNYDTSSVSYALKNYLPSEDNKSAEFQKFNEFPVTLEEDMVSKMSPILQNDYTGALLSSNSDTYKPIMNPLHDASPVDQA